MHEAVWENEVTDPHIHNLCNIWGEGELHVPATLPPNFSMHWSGMGLWTGLNAKGTGWIFHSAGNGSLILWLPSTSPYWLSYQINTKALPSTSFSCFFFFSFFFFFSSSFSLCFALVLSPFLIKEKGRAMYEWARDWRQAGNHRFEWLND